MSDKRGTMSAGHYRIEVPVETMLKLHKDLPKAKTPHGPDEKKGYHETRSRLVD
jgi:hypothetical protein